jgi:hypothetical protein
MKMLFWFLALGCVYTDAMYTSQYDINSARGSMCNVFIFDDDDGIIITTPTAH